MKDFIGYGGLHMLYKPLSRPSRYVFLLLVIVGESNGKYIFECVLNLLTFMTLRNGKVQDKEFKSF